MRATEIDAKIADCIAALHRIIYLPEGSLTAQSRLADLGLDSLDLMEAALELEALLGRDLPDAALAAARTVGDLADCLALPPPLALAA